MSIPTRRRKREGKVNVKLFIGLVPAIFATVLLVNLILSMQRGNEQEYVREVQDVWQQASLLTREYDSWLTKWKNGTLSDAEIRDITIKNISDIDQLIARLNATKPPERLKNAHEFAISSLMYEKESSENMLQYIITKDKQYLEKSDESFQRSFEYESKALAEFNRYGIGNIGETINVGG